MGAPEVQHNELIQPIHGYGLAGPRIEGAEWTVRELEESLGRPVVDEGG